MNLKVKPPIHTSSNTNTLETYRTRFDDNVIDGTTYKIFRCLPKSTDACSVNFAINTASIESGVVAEYSVTLDGVSQNGERVVCTDWKNGCVSGSTVTSFPSGGRSCPSSLSSGAIAGIVIGSIVGFALLVLVGSKLYKKNWPTGAEATAPHLPLSQCVPF